MPFQIGNQFAKGSKPNKTSFKKGEKAGDKHYNWKGGRKIDSFGYILIYSPLHPSANKQKYVFEQRLVVEKQINRYLTFKEVVHHINGIHNDNHPKNLMAFSSNGYHMAFEQGKNIPKNNIIFDGRQIKPSS